MQADGLVAGTAAPEGLREKEAGRSMGEVASSWLRATPLSSGGAAGLGWELGSLVFSLFLT